jgi:hypothetical protein
MEENKEIRKNKLIKMIGRILLGFGVVMLISSVINMMQTGIGNLSSMLLGLVLVFIGNTTRLVGKNQLDKIFNSK